MLEDLNYCAKLKTSKNKKHTIFPSLYFKVLFYSGLKSKNISFLKFLGIFRMMKYKNGIRQLTEKHSNKEIFLAGATASHVRGKRECHSQVRI